MTRTVSPHTLLERSADVLEKRGRTTGRFVARNGAVCARGAVMVATNELVDSGRPAREVSRSADDAESILRQYLIRKGIAVGFRFGSNLVEWNDRHFIGTGKDMAKVFRAAARWGRRNAKRLGVA